MSKINLPHTTDGRNEIISVQGQSTVPKTFLSAMEHLISSTHTFSFQIPNSSQVWARLSTSALKGTSWSPPFFKINIVVHCIRFLFRGNTFCDHIDGSEVWQCFN